MSGYGTAPANADVQKANSFRIEIDGIQVMAFEEYQFSDSECGVIEHRTGIDGPVNNTTAGNWKKATLTLTKYERKGGAADINELLNWSLARSGDKRNGAVITLDEAGAPIRRTNFSDGWISKYTPSEGNANEGEKVMIHKFVVEAKVVSYS